MVKLQVRKAEMLYLSGSGLCSLRRMAKLSQSALADRMNCILANELITQKKISRWEKSYEFEIDPEMFAVLEKALTST